MVVGLTAAACSGGMTETGSPARETTTTASSPATSGVLLDPEQFAAVVGDNRAYVVNVHVPDEGSIRGAGAAIPYDQLGERVAELPPDRSAPLAVYCLTGRMSAIAVAALADLGYTDVVESSGGMQAWATAGRILLPSTG